MGARSVFPLLLLLLATSAFAFALLALTRREDIFAALAVASGALALHALRRSIRLLEGT